MALNPESWIALSLVPEVGSVTFRNLISVFGNPDAVFRSPMTELMGINGISRQRAHNIKKFDGWRDVERQIKLLQKNNARIITYNCPDYPPLLRQIDDAPPVLYIKGTLCDTDRYSVAIVGSRKPTAYGKIIAERLSSDLAGAGFTIVSGMARGIDSVAHMSSLKSQGRTIAVLGSGIDKPYPPENRSLMDRIADTGSVITEFPVGTRPLKENFPRRNRLVSGLSMGVVVVEAAEGSGALITAHVALEQNREVFAVPGNITSPTSAGTNALIKGGATLVQTADDIIADLSPMLKGFMPRKNKASLNLSDEEQKLCTVMTGEPIHIDTLSRELSAPPAHILSVLLGLEIKGVVRQTDGKRFSLAYEQWRDASR